VVVGTSGSGKTTLARSLAVALSLPHTELDALHWGPNWTERPSDEFRAKVEEVIATPRWVIDGNYSAVRDRVWQRATTLVWLNLSFPLVFGRASWRTLRRLVTREELYSGNRESLRLVFDRDWIPWWVLRTYHRRRREFPALLQRTGYEHLQVVELTRRRQAAQLVQRLVTHAPSHPAETE
jgi:adenylate kinase family enzyme